MLEFVRGFLRANNNHSHLAIKNNDKLLVLVMFFALCAKMTKMRGCAREARDEKNIKC